jgi:predicted NUDIX family NTP pyrophosphohydrolase
VAPARFSAGLLLYRQTTGPIEVLLVHPGGPLWAKRDLGAWSIPKGEIDRGEDPLTAALREFREELGSEARVDVDQLVELGTVRQTGGKVVAAWAGAGDVDTETLASNRFEMEWPPRSGRTATFPEVDRAQWFDLVTARSKIVPAQAAFLERLLVSLA